MFDSPYLRNAEKQLPAIAKLDATRNLKRDA